MRIMTRAALCSLPELQASFISSNTRPAPVKSWETSNKTFIFLSWAISGPPPVFCSESLTFGVPLNFILISTKMAHLLLDDDLETALTPEMTESIVHMFDETRFTQPLDRIDHIQAEMTPHDSIYQFSGSSRIFKLSVRPSSFANAGLGVFAEEDIPERFSFEYKGDWVPSNAVRFGISPHCSLL
jgi:hypothetical protein